MYILDRNFDGRYSLVILSRYGFLREIRVRIRRQVVEDVSEDQISNSERESEGL